MKGLVDLIVGAVTGALVALTITALLDFAYRLASGDRSALWVFLFLGAVVGGWLRWVHSGEKEEG